MPSIVIRMRNDGPLIVEGPVTVCDAQGNAFAIPQGKPSVALCRCGQSANRPFCDGAHKRCDFRSSEEAPTGGDRPPVSPDAAAGGSPG